MRTQTLSHTPCARTTHPRSIHTRRVTGNHADFESPKAFKVQCDMTYGGGGWTLVHRANNKDHSSSDRCAQRTLRGEGGCTKDDGNFGEVSTVALRKFGGLEMKHVGGFCAYDKDTINALRTPTETLGSDTAGMRLGLDGAASQCSVFRYFKSECRYTVGDNTNNMRNGDECAFFKMSASKDEVDKEANTLDDVTTWTSSSCSGTWSAPGIRSCNSNSDYSAYCERDNDLDKDSIRGCNRICKSQLPAAILQAVLECTACAHAPCICVVRVRACVRAIVCASVCPCARVSIMTMLILLCGVLCLFV